ncbi:MAG: SufB/SufD family protein [Candidatus Dormibacteria bacterium]
MINAAPQAPADATALAEAAERAAASAEPWLRDRRRAAWDAFTAMPLPSSRVDEDWRRTDISRLRLPRFGPAGEVEESLLAALRERRNRTAPDAALLVDGAQASAFENTDELVAAGVVVTSLEEASRRHPDLVQRALHAVGVAESAFTALWNASWRGGAFVYVPRSVHAAVPLWVAHPAQGELAATFPATVVLLEDDARLTLIDDYLSAVGDEEILSDAVTVATLGRDARLEHHVIQQWGANVWHVALHRAVLGEGASLRFFGATLGARLQKAYWEAILLGRGSDARFNGLAFGDAAQHLDHQSLQAHRAPQTVSRFELKVAVRERARSVYSGLVDVDEVAQQTDAYVANRNLILGGEAVADSVPRLQIRANDVRCGHGATAGHVDDEQRVYLMSRGVPAEEADRIIVRGFFDDELTHCPHPGVAAFISDLLDAELAGERLAGVVTEA